MTLRAMPSARASCASCCSGRRTLQRWWRAVAGHRAGRAEPGPRAYRPPDRACASTGSAMASTPISASRLRPSTCSPPSPSPSGRSDSAWTRRAPPPEASPGSSTVCSSGWAPAPCASSIRTRAISPERAVRCAASPLPACGERVGVRGSGNVGVGCRLTQPSPHAGRGMGRGNCPPPAAPAAAPGAGRGRRAHPGRAAAAVPLARRPASGGRGARARAHRAGMVAPHRRGRRATTTSSRTRPAAASGSTAPASTTAAAPPRNGSCTGCLDERAPDPIN